MIQNNTNEKDNNPHIKTIPSLISCCYLIHHKILDGGELYYELKTINTFNFEINKIITSPINNDINRKNNNREKNNI